MEIGTHYLWLYMVDEFPDVFFENLSGFPSDREIEFCIDLVPEAQSVSVIANRMAPTKLIELGKQLDEQLDKVLLGAIPNLGELWSCLLRKLMHHLDFV